MLRLGKQSPEGRCSPFWCSAPSSETRYNRNISKHERIIRKAWPGSHRWSSEPPKCPTEQECVKYRKDISGLCQGPVKVILLRSSKHRSCTALWTHSAVLWVTSGKLSPSREGSSSTQVPDQAGTEPPTLLTRSLGWKKWFDKGLCA